jgi:DNA-binding IclR family transcriptional regulator
MNDMTAQQATTTLRNLDWSDQKIADKVVSSQSVINRIRLGQRAAPYHLANALVALAKKEARKAEKKAHGTNHA